MPSDPGQAARLTDRSAEGWEHAQLFVLERLREGASDNIEQPWSGEQWGNVANEARRNRVHLLLWHRLKDPPWRDAVPADVAAGLREQYRQNALRNALLFRQASSIVSAFAGAGIPTLLLKGLHLALAVYPEPVLRSMADLDLMVPRSQLVDAEQVLLGMGYGTRPRADASFSAAHFHHLERLVRDGAEVVELHHAIELPTSPFRIDVSALWDAARHVQVGGATARVLSDEHLVIHLCIHLAWHHAFGRAGLKALLDLTTLANARAATLDWPLVVHTAHEWRAEAFVRCALVMARDLLGAAIPDGSLGSMRHDTFDDTAVTSAKRLVLAGPLPHAVGPGASRPPEGLLQRAHYLALGLVPPLAQLRRGYGRPTVESALRLYPRRFRDLVQRRGTTILRAARERDTAWAVVQHLIDRGRIAHWIARHS
jgi:hypothetical protein